MLSNIEPHKSRGEYLKCTDFVTILDDILSEHDQEIQKYVKTELYISVIKLFQYLLAS